MDVETGIPRRRGRVDGLHLDADAGTNSALPDMTTTLCEQHDGRRDPQQTDRLDWGLGHRGAEPHGDRLHALQSRIADGGGHPALAQHYAPTDYVPNVRINLSATVTFINLQSRGCVKVTA